MTWEVDSSGIGRGLVTLDGIVGYNGSWDSSWGSTSSRSAYAGRNQYYTVIKFTISADYNSGSGSGWIAIGANLLSNVNTQTNYNRTLSYGISKTAPTLNDNAVGFPSSFIGGQQSYTWTVNNQSKKSWFQVGNQNSPISFTPGTYYLWIWSTSSSEIGLFYKGESYYSAAAAMFAYTSCSPPTNFNPKVTNIKYNEDVTVTWNPGEPGVGQPITGYEILYKYGTSPSESSYDGRVTTSSTASSAVISIPFKSLTSNRGKTAYFKIRTLSSNPAYYSSFKESINKVKCNSLPVISNLSADKTSFASDEAIEPKITITASDSDGQSITFYYQKPGNATKTKFTSGSTLTLGEGTYYFYAYDTKEYSTVKSITFVKNTAPVINKVEDKLARISGYLTGGTITATVNKNNGSCTCTLMNGSSGIKTYTGSLNNSVFTFTINTSDFLNETADKTINKVSISYTDSNGETISKEESLISTTILGSNNINNFNLTATLESDISDNTLKSTYFNKKFNCTINTTSSTNFIQSKTLNLYNTYDNKSYNFNFDTEISLDYSLTVYNGLNFTPKVTLKDLYGREVTKTLSTTIIKIIPISFNGTEGIVFNPGDTHFKPLSEEISGNLTISFAVSNITFNGTIINSKDLISKFNLYFSDTKYSTSTNISLNGSTLTITFGFSTLKEIWDNLYDSQKKNGSTITINPTLKVVDILGNTSEGRSTTNFTIDYNEAPVFGGSKAITLLHKKMLYNDINEVNSKISAFSDLPGTSPSASNNKINGGEIIVIKHPIATDKNTNNNLVYNVYSKFLINSATSEFLINNTNNYLQFCKTIQYSDYLYWIFLVKKEIQICEIQRITIEVSDGSNKTTLPLDLSNNNKISLFPTKDFNFKCTNCQFSNNNGIIYLNTNFETSNISGYSNYSTYENLERSGEDNFNKSKMQIYYSENLNNLNTSLLAELSLSSFSNVSKFSSLETFSLTSYNTTKDATKKGYFRFKLILNYGIKSDNSNDQREVWSDIFFFENLEPTVSYRKNTVSINHKIKDEEIAANGVLKQSVFSVFSTANNSKIYLVNNNNDSQKIIIDLTNGTISGATINGGSW